MYDVVPDDIRAIAFGVTIPEGDAANRQINALIAEAIILVEAGVPGLRRRVEDNETLTALTETIIKKMVLRVLKNPRSLRSIGIDDLNATIDSAASTGELYLSDTEAALLAESTPGGLVGSIRLGVPRERLPRDR